MNQEIIKAAISLIGESKFKELFELLEDKLDDSSDSYFDVIHQKSRFTGISKKENKGLISFYEAELEYSKIRHGLIEIIKEIKNNFNQDKKKEDDTESANDEVGLILNKYETIDYSYFDHISEFEEETSKMTEAMLEVNISVDDLSLKMTERTNQILNLKKGDKKVNVVVAKKVVSAMSDEINIFNYDVNDSIGKFKLSAEKSVKSGFKALTLMYEQGKADEQELLTLEEAIEETLPTLTNLQDNIVKCKDTFGEWPKLFKDINKSKRNLISVLDLFIDEIKNYESNLISFQISIKSTLKSIKEKSN
jgi:hypothetical protein